MQLDEADGHLDQVAIIWFSPIPAAQAAMMC